MGMTLTVYNISDDPRKLTKTLGTAIGTYTVNPTDNCDILNPVVSVHSTGQNAFPLNANYATLSDTGRQYFIKDITLGTGGKVFVHLAVDVLGTYDTDIKNCNCCVRRTVSAGINWVPDDKFPLDTAHTRVYAVNETFDSPFLDNAVSYILTVINDRYVPDSNSGGGN